MQPFEPISYRLVNSMFAKRRAPNPRGVYISGSWGHKEYIRDEVVPLFEAADLQVTSRWLYEPIAGEVPLVKVPDNYLQQAAIKDVEDVFESHALVLYSNGIGTVHTGGGRFFEMGMAFMLDLPIITVGDREMVFQYLPETELFFQVLSWEGAIEKLRELEDKRLALVQIQQDKQEQGRILRLLEEKQANEGKIIDRDTMTVEV